MKSNKNEEIFEDTQKPPYTGKVYAYIAIGLTAAAAVFLGLIFTVLGIYSLIASIVLSLASLSFVNVQKRKNNFANLKIINGFAYAVLVLGVAVLVGGIIYSAIK